MDRSIGWSPRIGDVYSDASLSYAGTAMHILKPALVYALIVFGTGFVLGTIRVLFVLPLLGERTAELLEMPLMLAVIVLAARWITRRYLQQAQPRDLLAVGGIATGWMLAAEFLVGLTLRGLSPMEVLVNRDPVSGTDVLSEPAALCPHAPAPRAP